QARELADARSLDPYTVREWVDFDGATYVEDEGEVEVLAGIRLLPTPGHTDGHQSVLVETGGRPVVVGGDVAGWFGELGGARTRTRAGRRRGGGVRGCGLRRRGVLVRRARRAAHRGPTAGARARPRAGLARARARALAGGAHRIHDARNL